MKNNYLFYIPIVVVLALGFAIGAYLSFGIVFLKVLPEVSDHYGRTILALFGMGMLGGSTYCAKYWAKDIEEVVYQNPEFLPHLFDFFGYVALIVGAGITGVILFLIFKTGIGISVNGQTEIYLSKEASALIAYMGGLYHFKVQNQLGKVMEKIFKEHRDKQAANERSGT